MEIEADELEAESVFLLRRMVARFGALGRHFWRPAPAGRRIWTAWTNTGDNKVGHWLDGSV